MVHDRQVEAAERVALRRWLRANGLASWIDKTSEPSANDRMMRAVQSAAGILKLNDIIARAHDRVAAHRQNRPKLEYIV